MESARSERWGIVGVIIFCGVAWYWKWAAVVPRWWWAFAGIGFFLWRLARTVDRLQAEISSLRERVWQLESKHFDHRDDRPCKVGQTVA